MQEPPVAQSQIAELLRSVFAATRLELDFTIMQHPGAVPDLTVEFTGPDTACLTARDAELLKALEHIAAKVRRLEPDQHDLLSFEADNYKRNRDQALLAAAKRAVKKVGDTSLPFTFSPMSSHERRQLHIVLNEMGFKTESAGAGPARRVILYPAESPASRCSCKAVK